MYKHVAYYEIDGKQRKKTYTFQVEKTKKQVRMKLAVRHGVNSWDVSIRDLIIIKTA